MRSILLLVTDWMHPDAMCLGSTVFTQSDIQLGDLEQAVRLELHKSEILHEGVCLFLPCILTLVVLNYVCVLFPVS